MLFWNVRCELLNRNISFENECIGVFLQKWTFTYSEYLLLNYVTKVAFEFALLSESVNKPLILVLPGE